MNPTFAVETTIDRPADAVWAALTDWSSAPSWMNGIDSMRADSETAVGTRLLFHTRGADRESQIVVCEPGRKVVLRSIQGQVTADYAYELKPAGEQTEVSLTASCEIRGWMRLFGPLLRLAIKWTDGGQLEALKGRIERGATPA